MFGVKGPSTWHYDHEWHGEASLITNLRLLKIPDLILLLIHMKQWILCTNIIISGLILSSTRNDWQSGLLKFACFVSLHIRSMWETICDAWACWSGWNFGPNSTEYPYSEIQFQNTPPENENCQRSWHFDFSVSEYCPPWKLKFRQILVLWLFSFRIPPPPKIEI